MTILCVAAWPGVPGVPPCHARDVHWDSCSNDECRGCYPRSAERGYLCQYHYDKAERAEREWPDWYRLAIQLGGSRAVTPESVGGRSAVLGHVNLDAVHLAVDECLRLQPSTPVAHAAYVGTTGAFSALAFAAAAERAFRSIPVVEKPHRIRSIICPNCGLPMIWNPPSWVEAAVTITCPAGHTFTQDEFEEMQ